MFAYNIRIRPNANYDAIEIAMLDADENVLCTALFDPQSGAEFCRAVKDAGDAVAFFNGYLPLSEELH